MKILILVVIFGILLLGLVALNARLQIAPPEHTNTPSERAIPVMLSPEQLESGPETATSPDYIDLHVAEGPEREGSKSREDLAGD